MKIPFMFFLLVLSSCAEQANQQPKQEEFYDYDVEARLKELGVELKAPTFPPNTKLNLLLASRTGNLVYLSGNGPLTPDGSSITGKVGTDLTIEQGYEAARLTAINHLTVLKSEIGDLNKVEKIVKVFGMVNAGPDFTEQPKVINGYSDFMVEVFGERGKHARSAVGMASLPWNIACELEAIVQVRD